MNRVTDLPAHILDNQLTAVILLDSTLQVHYVNPAAEQLLGISARRLLANPLTQSLEYLSLDLARLQE